MRPQVKAKSICEAWERCHFGGMFMLLFSGNSLAKSISPRYYE